MSATPFNSLPSPSDLSGALGRIDIYLLDQLLKGNIDIEGDILDAGCGGGRNLIYLLRLGANVYGIDRDKVAVEEVRRLANKISKYPESHFQVAELSHLPFNDQAFDCIICSAVLHFAESETHFRQMVEEMWRVLRPGGIIFARFATSIGILDHLQPIEGKKGWYILPDGTERFLGNAHLLNNLTKLLGANMYEPIKTVHVFGMRSMTNWMLLKP